MEFKDDFFKKVEKRTNVDKNTIIDLAKASKWKYER